MNERNRRKIGVALCSLVIVTALVAMGMTALAAPEAAPDAEGLFVATEAQGSLDLSGDATITRSRFVDVDIGMLASFEVGDKVALNFFPDTLFSAILDRKAATQPDGFAWIGHIDGQELSQVVLVVGGGQVAGNVSMPGAFYQLRYAGNEVHVVQQLDQSALPPEAEPLVPDLPDEAPPESPLAPTDACADIDVMVVWTPAARTAAGGTTAMQNLVNLAVAETNQSYINSGLVQRINLAHMEEVSYTESGSMGTDLTRVTSNGDGFMDNVHALRDTHYADLVSLFVESTEYCGIAWMMGTVSPTFQANAFSVVARTCATGYYSFGHEMGHNMGARHDWYVDATLNSPYSYDKGYLNWPDSWRTIMSYNNECADHSVYCTRLQYWSNPSVIYGGDAMGVPIGTSTACVAGDLGHPACDADNRTALNNTCSTVANWRDEPAGAVGPIYYWSRTIDDDNLGNSSGNSDGYVDCGENIELYVDLFNDGADPATGVIATISTSDPYVTFLFNTASSYPDIAGGSSATNTDDFDIAVDPATPNNHSIVFDLDITASNGGPWSASFSVPVICLSPDAYEPDDDAGSATPITSGVPQTHNIYPVGDEDWVSFTLAETSEVILETSGPSGDSRMWLFDSGLTEIEYNDDGGGGLWSRIDRLCGVDALPAGTYYVMIDEFGDNWTIEEYDINYTLVGPCVEPPPEIEVVPSSFMVTLPVNDSTTELMTISNSGGEPLNFGIFDLETGAPDLVPAAPPEDASVPDGVTSYDADAFPLETPEAGAPAPAPPEQPGYPPGAAAISTNADAFEQITPEVIMAGNPVLIIQDVLPWSYDSIQQILTANGIPYDQIDSTLIPAVDLSPYEMVIIPSVQGEAFYNTWNANIGKFEAYVAAGGKLWQSTCNYSATAVEPLTPGGVLSATDLDPFNDIVAPGHRWVAGVPNPMSGSYASHDSFTNLYPGSTVVAQAQTTGLPTLVDYRYGAGRVLITGQTLEITWVNGWDGALILENSLLDMYYTAEPVLIIQDWLPWGMDAIEQILTAHGITYYHADSSLIPTIDLSPYEMVIIPSVQGDTIYNTWNANIGKFEAYVAAGGKLWQSTCNIPGAVEPLAPGGVLSADDLQDYNDIVAPGHPWVAGVPSPMYGNYASHDSFTNLYAGSTVVAQAQTTGLPTLVDYQYGAGRVLITGQTLEWSWWFGNDGGPILENSLVDMLGLADAPWLTESPSAGAVAPGDFVDISVTFDATGLVPGNYTADIIIPNNDPDENPTVVPAIMEVVPPPGADLEVSKVDLMDPVVVGSPVIYELIITNHGPEVATNVVLSDTLPNYAPFVSASGPCSPSGRQLTCNLGNLNAGQSVGLEVVVLAPESTASLLNVAEVNADTYEWNPGNNYVTEQTLVITEYVPHDCDQPGNPIINCSFEDDHLDWITQDLLSPLYSLRTGGAGETPGYGLFVSAPTHGSWATLHGFDGDGPGWIRVAQDVNLPATADRLVFDYRGGWDLLNYSWPGTGERFFHVNIEPAGGGAPLQTTPIVSATIGTFIPDTDNLSGIVDISAFAGTAVRISFDWYVPDSYSGPAFFQLDNVLVTEALPVPDIEVDPTVLYNEQPPNTQDDLPFAVRNVGGADLSWSIVESPAADVLQRDVSTGTPNLSPADRSPTSGGTIIDNGLIMMGVHEQGHLNIPGPASSGGVPYVGLRYLPTNAEATAPGCLCEGWGVADAISGVTGYANEDVDLGAVNMSVLDFAATPSTARSEVQVGTTFAVSHEYRPSTHTPNLYEVVVTVQNISAAPAEVLYRRVMDWDIEPTAFSEFVTIQGTAGAANVTFASDDGFASANPLAGSSSIDFTGDAVDNGPTDHGALFDFNFGLLNPGERLSFTTYYGAAATESEALSALAAVGAQVYSLGQPSTPDGPTLGTPNTFIFGFADVGGTPVCTPSDVPWAAVSPDSGVTPPAGETMVDVHLDSTGLGAGTYAANLCVYSNDPDEPVVLVPVTMEVVPPGTELYIEPPVAEIPVSGTFTVDVMVGDVADLYGASLELAFDPTYVEVVDDDPGTAGVQITPGTCPSPDFVVHNDADNATGIISYDVASLSPSPPCNGTGVVASITFHGLVENLAGFPLHFNSWLLADTNGFEISTTASDGTLIVTQPASTVYGHVYLQGRTNHSGAEVCVWDGPTIVDCATTDPDGYYEILVPPGTYDVTAEMARYLDSERSGEVVPTGPHALPDVTLRGGDHNDDCTINILDLAFMGARFGLNVGDPGWDDRADINADGTVNIQDIVLAGGNFGRTCPVPWP